MDNLTTLAANLTAGLPANLTNKIKLIERLGAQQIWGAIQGYIIGLIICIILMPIGYAMGKSMKNSIAKLTGAILAIIGLVGTISFIIAIAKAVGG